MNNPDFVKINNKKYKINTDFRIAIKCNEVATSNINDYEKGLAIIFLLFGDYGLNNCEDYEKLFGLGLRYLNCGNENQSQNEDEEQDMDFIQDQRLIESSFKYDYGYNPYKEEYIHWWDFYNDLCNLSNSEFGNCCVLNRVRNLRTYDTSQIKDRKTRERIEKSKKQVALKKKEKEKTEEEKKLDNLFEKQLRGE